MHTDHDAPNGQVNPESVKLGHEPDDIDVRPVLTVPIIIIITIAATMTIVMVIVTSMRTPTKDPNANALAAERSETKLKDRLARTSSDPKQSPDLRQPRLDGLNRLTTEQPPWVQSSDPTKEGNSPDYHPEDMRPSSEYGKELGLQDFGWKDKEKTVMHIPIAEALKLLGQGASDQANAEAKKLYLRVLKFENKVNPQEMAANRPKASNPFWGIPVKTQPKEETKGGGH